MNRQYAIERFKDQRGKAAARGISFQLTFEEWDNWWMANNVDRNIPRKHNKNTLCMCRYGDVGPYSLTNIYCASLAQNTKDSPFNKQGRSTGSFIGHTGLVGTKSPFAKVIITPKGEFGCQKDAYMAYNVDKTTMARWLIKKSHEFYYKEVA